MTKSATSSSADSQRVVLIGAGGLIGRAILARLEAEPGRYEVIGVGRRTTPSLDLEDVRSIARCFDALAPFDHVIVAAGEARFAELGQLDASSFTLGIDSKLMGQVHVTLAALPRLRAGGSVTLTSGALSHTPTRGSTPAALVNGALDSFVRAVALELDDGRRVNVVSPGWVTDTLVAFGMDPAGGVSAPEVAELYLQALESEAHGQVIGAVRARRRDRGTGPAH
jgi:NAD(P)-dependent dehydrogenase (short-subunit alcohol dehydrogenase family)